MNDTEHGAPRERGTIFSVFRYPWLDSPVDPTAATLLLLRENAGVARVAFVSLLKIISIFVANGAEGGSAARGSPRSSSCPKFIIAGVNERTFSRSRCTLIFRLTHVTAICLCKFDTAVINSQRKYCLTCCDFQARNLASFHLRINRVLKINRI